MERRIGSSMFLVYQEADRMKGGILTQKRLKTGEEFPIVERETGESLKVIFCGNGIANVQVRKLTVHKKLRFSYMKFVSHLWDPSAAERDPNRTWTRNGPLPFGASYDSTSMVIGWNEGPIRKSLIWLP